MSRILVAEDDPHILRVISLWLARQGHEVLEARDGLEALNIWRHQRPDILVTDVNMPGLDGLELLDRIVGDRNAPRGLVVLTNRWDHREIGQKLADWGVHVVPKPFSPTKLAELVNQLQQQGLSQSAPAPSE
ncbi:MAG: response regulator [Phycisphaerae bacterium]|jgi:CheY-like chemotaxis protein